MAFTGLYPTNMYLATLISLSQLVETLPPVTLVERASATVQIMKRLAAARFGGISQTRFSRLGYDVVEGWGFCLTSKKSKLRKQAALLTRRVSIIG